jgi:hypothetical protein
MHRIQYYWNKRSGPYWIQRRGGLRVGGAHPAPPPPKIGKNMIFFGVKSWFFTRNTRTIFAPPSARRKFFKCAPPLIWNPGSAPVTGFFFRMSTQVKAEVRSTKAVIWVRMRKKKPAISNTGKFFCFNNSVSNLYNNSVVAKIYGMAYIFTLLVFRKPNKTTINKNKTTNFYRSTSFQFSFIFRYFKVFQVKRIVHI